MFKTFILKLGRIHLNNIWLKSAVTEAADMTQPKNKQKKDF